MRFVNPLNPTRPVVLCIAGQDPSGGAGIQADIETVAALGGHACSAITAVTIQDSTQAFRIVPMDPATVAEQIQTVRADLTLSAVKLGMLATPDIAVAVAQVLQAIAVPVVLDPVLAAGGGGSLARDGLCETLRETWFPLGPIITPNSLELRRLTGIDDLERGAQAALAAGCAAVLLTGTHEATAAVENHLFQPGSCKHWMWPRLPESYHGSGCTLAAALAAGLASGLPLIAAAEQAQDFTWRSLAAGFRPGRGQWFPARSGI